MSHHQKWYFAANRNALSHAFDQIRVAVTSARLRTNLQPYCLIDTYSSLEDVSDRLYWLENAGVHLIPHQAELFSIVRDHFGQDADPFSGHWLRCDIPILDLDDDFVFYTDIDVMFKKDVDYSEIRPLFMACTPEHRQDDFSYFNSGVMVMNLPALRQTRPHLIETLTAIVSSSPPYDQGALNESYKKFWDRLPNTWNWKPYWGYSPDAVIVHFHGPKPAMLRRMMNGEVDLFAPEYGEIFARDTAAYARYLAEFDAFYAASAAMCDAPAP
jgi:hypothetical protein